MKRSARRNWRGEGRGNGLGMKMKRGYQSIRGLERVQGGTGVKRGEGRGGSKRRRW